MIPKRIVQTGPPGISLLLQSAVAGVRALHSDFEYLFFSDAEIEAFIGQESPEHRRIWSSFPYRIQRYDFFRYLAIYRLGGIYLDLDVFLARPLTPLLSAGCVFPFEELTAIRFLWDHFRMDWQVGNYAFGATAGNRFLAAVIENCVRAQVDKAWAEPMMRGIPRAFRSQFYVLNTTGPGLVSRTLAERHDLAPALDILFPADVRNPETWHRFGDFGVHHMSGSWRDTPGRVGRRLLRVWDEWTLRRILAAAKTRGGIRNLADLKHLDVEVPA